MIIKHPVLYWFPHWFLILIFGWKKIKAYTSFHHCNYFIISKSKQRIEKYLITFSLTGSWQKNIINLSCWAWRHEALMDWTSCNQFSAGITFWFGSLIKTRALASRCFKENAQGLNKKSVWALLWSTLSLPTTCHEVFASISSQTCYIRLSRSSEIVTVAVNTTLCGWLWHHLACFGKRFFFFLDTCNQGNYGFAQQVWKFQLVAPALMFLPFSFHPLIPVTLKKQLRSSNNHQHHHHSKWTPV